MKWRGIGRDSAKGVILKPCIVLRNAINFAETFASNNAFLLASCSAGPLSEHSLMSLLPCKSRKIFLKLKA